MKGYTHAKREVSLTVHLVWLCEQLYAESRLPQLWAPGGSLLLWASEVGGTNDEKVCRSATFR
jgi:hypothetical protein